MRNVVDELPREQHAQVLNVMRAAWKLSDADEGMKRLEGLARFLEHEYESAARSLREGMAEMFTIQRLKLPPSLYKCLGTTNVIESPQSGVQKRTGNVTRWRDAEMVERWLPPPGCSQRSTSARSSDTNTFGRSPSILEEKKFTAPRRKWRNMNPSAVSAFNYGWECVGETEE
jgi:hypothetical protein